MMEEMMSDSTSECFPCRRCNMYDQICSKPPPRLRRALDDPRSCLTARSVRGFRPQEFYTRGTSLGGGAAVDGVAGVKAEIRPQDGFITRPESCLDYMDAPRIQGCSRFCATPTSFLLERYRKEREQAEKLQPRRADSESDDEEDCPKCVCAAVVETRPVTSDAFTMVECCTRDQGTVIDTRVTDKSVETEYLVRDVATDVDDLLPPESPPYDDDHIIFMGTLASSSRGGPH